MNEAFLRMESLLGREAMDKLAQSHVAVLGLGGVGSWAAEALCRAGVGTLTLMDSDTVGLSNMNRQLYALHSTVGLPKAEVAAARCRDIAADVTVYPIVGTYDAAHRDEFFCRDYDYIVDCIDLVSCKLDLIEQARARRIPILCALGTGNKLDAASLQVADIAKTYGCPLARVMRKELRNRGIHHLKVVFSPEEPHEAQQTEAPPQGRRSIPGSVVWVPATAGLLMAQTVVEDLVKEGADT
ncbi:MAG: tRNA threonylcarbamoyladenosine dehydratase [Oscillospiraceae bacterium]|nr:tRNA threonylcarbamoyladenosine dehydratase [Oscillospiraceae bacterium]